MNTSNVCIIGAGAAGIAAANAISRAGLDFDWFEASSQLGGIWRYDNDNGSSVYASLTTNTSQANMEWFGYRMPGVKNDYLTHQQVLDYLASFVAHANLGSKITFSTPVTSVESTQGGGFRVRAESRAGERFAREYRAVIVAVGCHSTPKWPKIPGLLNTARMHSAEYRSPEIFAGKRIVVAGFGASGVDIACDASDTANSVTLSTRSGGYVLPRYVGGRPRDENARPWIALAPVGIRKQLWRIMLLRRAVSPKVRSALERRAAAFAKPAVINDRLADLIDSDRIGVKPGIQRLEGDRVIFTDDTWVPCDLLVCATGYEAAYPFFSSEMAEQNGAFINRYLRVIPPNQPRLYFVGRISVVGPFFPTLERQALWVADLLSDRCTLPSAAEMRRRAAKETKAAAMIFQDAGRHPDVVEYYPYLRALNREHKAGRIRQRKTPSTVRGAALALDPEMSE